MIHFAIAELFFIMKLNFQAKWSNIDFMDVMEQFLNFQTKLLLLWKSSYFGFDLKKNPDSLEFQKTIP